MRKQTNLFFLLSLIVSGLLFCQCDLTGEDRCSWVTNDDCDFEGQYMNLNGNVTIDPDHSMIQHARIYVYSDPIQWQDTVRFYADSSGHYSLDYRVGSYTGFYPDNLNVFARYQVHDSLMLRSAIISIPWVHNEKKTIDLFLE